MFETLYQTVAPATEPVTINELNAQLRIDTSDENTLLTTKIISARQAAEAYLGKVLITQTWVYGIEYFVDGIELPITPVQSVSSITYYDGSSDQTFSNYNLVKHNGNSRIYLKPNYQFPNTYDRAASYPANILITFVAGYGAASAVPQSIKDAILIHSSYFAENREFSGNQIIGQKLPIAFFQLLNPYRRMQI